MFKNQYFALRILSFLAASFIISGCGVKGDLVHPSEQNAPTTEQTLEDSEEQS